ncbi:DNA repair protein RadC [Gammaproteobacteria bacterium]|nr:DNA repair protein RadC [Gammaproteobacteria bacterium]
MTEHEQLTAPPGLSIRDWPLQERPRERLLAHGADGLSDSELLSIFIGSGHGGQSAVDLARRLISAHGSLQQVMLAIHRGESVAGFGPARRASVLAAMELASRTIHAQTELSQSFTHPTDAAELLMHHLYGRDQEVVCGLFLDTRHRRIALQDLFYGTVNGAAVYPREIARRALVLNASAVIIAHNHPSGDAEPSRADGQVTRQLHQALTLVDVRLADHIVIGGGRWVSLAERGVIPG